MTVYDNAHIGHARAMVVFDAFVRCCGFVDGTSTLCVASLMWTTRSFVAPEQDMEPMALAENTSVIFDAMPMRWD